MVYFPFVVKWQDYGHKKAGYKQALWLNFVGTRLVFVIVMPSAF